VLDDAARAAAEGLELGGDVADITTWASVAKLIGSVVARSGGLDGVVNAADVTRFEPAENVANEELLHVLDVASGRPGVCLYAVDQSRDRPRRFSTSTPSSGACRWGRRAEPEGMVGTILFPVSDVASFGNGAYLVADGGRTASVGPSTAFAAARADRRRLSCPGESRAVP